MILFPKEKIFEPVIRKITAGYRRQVAGYEEMLDLSYKQRTLVSREDIYAFVELNKQKAEILEKIAKEEAGLKKSQEEIVKALQIDAFTISALKKELSSPSIDELQQTLKDVGLVIARAEQAEAQNEKDFKKMMHSQ